MRDAQRNGAKRLKGGGHEFLFAVVRDAQQNEISEEYFVETGIVSIRCRARRAAERQQDHRHGRRAAREFLFAVVRDAQRNGMRE